MDVTIGCVAGTVCFGNEITHILFRLTNSTAIFDRLGRQEAAW